MSSDFFHYLFFVHRLFWLWLLCSAVHCSHQPEATCLPPQNSLLVTKGLGLFLWVLSLGVSTFSFAYTYILVWLWVELHTWLLSSDYKSCRNTNINESSLALLKQADCLSSSSVVQAIASSKLLPCSVVPYDFPWIIAYMMLMLSPTNIKVLSNRMETGISTFLVFIKLISFIILILFLA